MVGYIVMWSDFDGGLVQPYTWADDCQDALQLAGPDDDLAFFDSKKAARRAINVSVAFAKFNRLRGQPANDDFLDGNVKNVRLWRVGQKASTG